MTDSPPEGQIDDVVRAFHAAKAWEETSALVSSDALYMICHHVLAGEISVREAARRTKLPKSTMARLVDRAKVATSFMDDPTVFMSPDVYPRVHEIAWGVPEDAPFVRDTDDQGKTVLRWRG